MGEGTLAKQQIVGQMDSPSCKNHPGKVGMTACTCALIWDSSDSNDLMQGKIYIKIIKAGG